MALTIYVEVSTTGLADGDFTALTNYPDIGIAEPEVPADPVSYDHTPVEPGQLYIYRARRFDSNTGLYSSWAYAFARAPYPIRISGMIDTTEVLTNKDEALYVAIEAFEGVPTKAAYKAELVSGGFNMTLGRRFSRIKRNARTRRRAGVKGPISYQGAYTLEVRAEGAFLAFLASAMAYENTTDLTVPTRYTHRYSNKKGLKSLTVIHRIGDIYYVHTGVKSSSFKLSPDWNGTDTLLVSLDMEACGLVIFDKRITPTVETILGIATATADLSTPYAPDDGSTYLDGVRGAGCQDLQFTLQNELVPYKERDGTRSAKGLVEGTGDPTATATTYFSRETMSHHYRDLGYSADPTTSYGPKRGTLITAPVRMEFDPPADGGVVNTLLVSMPHCDMTTAIELQDNGEVRFGLNISPIDAEGESADTDCFLEVTNTVDGVEVVAAGTPIDPTSFQPQDDRRYEIGKATGVPTTTSISSAANPHFDTTDDVYIGRRLRFITGANAGEEREVTDYVGASRTFQTSAFAGAAAADDFFVLI